MFSSLELEQCRWKPVGSNGETSVIFTTVLKGKQIIKKILKSENKEEFYNETSCLQALQHSKHFPVLYHNDPNKLVIYMSYCGKTMTPETRPKNWKEQIDTILDTVYKANIVYSDIKPDHLRVHSDNTIRVIDFGRATVGPQRRYQDIHKFAQIADFVSNP